MRRLPRIESPFLLEIESLPCDDELYVRWPEVFGARHSLRIELGVGNSPFLVEVAKHEPDHNYLGFEYSGKRVLKFLKKVHRADLTNIRILRLNAERALRERVRAGTVNHFFVNFPDPWPRRRQAKKRFVRADNAELVARLLEDGGGFSLRTDAEHYARQMLEVLDDCTGLTNLCGAGCFADMPLYPFPTPYELKFRAEGRRIYYLEYRKALGSGD